MKFSPALLSFVRIATFTGLAGNGCRSGTAGHPVDGGHLPDGDELRAETSGAGSGGTGGHGTGGVAGRSGGGETGAGGVGSGGAAGGATGAGGVALDGAEGCGRCDAGPGEGSGGDARGGTDGGGDTASDSGNALGLDAAGGTDGARGTDAGEAGEIGRDAAEAGGPICGEETDYGALGSSECSVAVADPAVQCSGAGPCPVTAAYTLGCPGHGQVLQVAPLGSNGASVMFVTNNTFTHLFSLAPGAARVDKMPALKSGVNALAVDSAGGNRTIFAGEMPGVWRVRETASGWLRESAVEMDPGTLAFLGDARVLDGNRAFVVYTVIPDYGVPRLAVREGGCWRTSVLPGQSGLYLNLDLDGSGRPWVAWNYSANVVQMAGPDGTLYTPWTAPTGSTLLLYSDDRAIVLGAGVTATKAAYPSLVIQRNDGVRVLVGDTALPRWTVLGIAGSAATATTNPCPSSLAVPSDGCGAIASCTAATKGATYGFGAARTASGRAYVAWIATDGDTTYGYRMDFQCAPERGLKQCCNPAVVTSSSGVSSVVLTRADTGAEALRLTLETGRPMLSSTSVALAARGDTLLVVAGHDNGSDIEMRYQEVDATRLP